MTDEPYLVAHKVRGEPAFDIAIQQPCAICLGSGSRQDEDQLVCEECDGLGYWWICSTSGHRAYPWWGKRFDRISCEGWLAVYDDPWRDIPPMPEGLPDHYRVNASPRAKVADVGRSLLAKLGLSKPTLPIKRRI